MRIIAFLLFFLSGLVAIEIDVRPDKKIDVAPQDISAMKYYLKKTYRFITTDEGAKRLVNENRLLANAFLKSKYWKQFNKDLFKIEIERKLADEFVKYVQEEEKIPEKVLKSYYYDHIEEFKQSPRIHLIRYSFPSYQKAHEFYVNYQRTHKIDPSLLKKLDGFQKDNGYVELSKIKEPLKTLIEKQQKKGYMSPPFVWAENRYDLYYVADVDTSKKYKPFDQVKDRIKEILYQETFVKKRDEILARYNKGASE